MIWFKITDDASMGGGDLESVGNDLNSSLTRFGEVEMKEGLKKLIKFIWV